MIFILLQKIIDAPDTIYVNQEFPLRLILRNDSLEEMKFTIDKEVTKSLSFNLDFRCNTTLLYPKVANPKPYDENLKEYFLKKGDSLDFNLSGILISQPNDSLAFKIKGQARIYKLKNPHCQKFYIDFGGMWLPGDLNPLDAMEGYNFRKIVVVKQ